MDFHSNNTATYNENETWACVVYGVWVKAFHGVLRFSINTFINDVETYAD